MSKVKFKDVIYYIFLVLVVIGVMYSVRLYSQKMDRKKMERKKKETVLVDSLRQIEQERSEKEYNEHLLQFYDAFNKYYPVFSSPDELDKWLSQANSAAFGLLYDLFCVKYDEFDGPDGFDQLSNYLFWGPREYAVECEVCGNTTTFSSDEL